MKYQPEDGTWIVSKAATNLKTIRKGMDEALYNEAKKSLKKYLCEYFSNGLCNSKSGNAISPLKGTKKGGKVLKVRWGLPGMGKRGGLRLIVVAYCDKKTAVLAEGFKRNEDPSDAEIKTAISEL